MNILLILLILLINEIVSNYKVNHLVGFFWAGGGSRHPPTVAQRAPRAPLGGAWGGPGGP